MYDVILIVIMYMSLLTCKIHKSALEYSIIRRYTNVVYYYVNPNMEIINSSDNVLELGIIMSSNCSFEFHIINNLCKNVQACPVGS